MTWMPLYDQAALDAAMAAERERWHALLRELHECGAITNWLRVSEDLRQRVEDAMKA